MKKHFTKIIVFTSLLSLIGCSNSNDPATWSNAKIDKWFEKGEWLSGLQITPDASINRKEFAIAYFKNTEIWEKAFAFLNSPTLSTLDTMKYFLNGNNLFATVSEYLTKNEENANFEAHRKYIDIQYVVSGEEKIGFAPLSEKKEVIVPYNDTKDIEFFTATGDSNLAAKPDRFFIFFPSDAHRPGLRDGENSMVRKIVVKIKID